MERIMLDVGEAKFLQIVYILHAGNHYYRHQNNSLTTPGEDLNPRTFCYLGECDDAFLKFVDAKLTTQS
jgi:hypothetical protein